MGGGIRGGKEERLKGKAWSWGGTGGGKSDGSGSWGRDWSRSWGRDRSGSRGGGGGKREKLLSKVVGGSKVKNISNGDIEA